MEERVSDVSAVRVRALDGVRPHAEFHPAPQADFFLPVLAPDRFQRRLALAVLAVSLVVFALAAPFAKVQLADVPAFLPAYQSALVTSDFVTAVLLFGQFRILRGYALLVLASGYVFSACMAVFHALSFPGLFTRAGLLGGDSETTAWIYFLWHAAFPLFVGAYAVLKTGAAVRRPATNGAAHLQIALGIAAALALACALALAAPHVSAVLPSIMNGDLDAHPKVIVAAATCLLSVLALATLWRRRPHSVLDLWVMVVLTAWIFDISLAAVLNHGRYDVGWYAGRVYGLLAATAVLAVLLLENGALHARLAEHRERERRRAEHALARHVERLTLLHRIDRAILAGEPSQSLIETAIRPLRVLLDAAYAVVMIFDSENRELTWCAADSRDGAPAAANAGAWIRAIGDVGALCDGEPRVIDARTLPAGPDRDALLACGARVYRIVPLIASGELIGALGIGGADGGFSSEDAAIAHESGAQLAIALEHGRLFERIKRQSEELELRVRLRTADLEAVNKELESFSYSVSHDLRSPLRAVDGYSRILEEDHADKLDGEGRRVLQVIRESSRKMSTLIDDLLALSRLGRTPLAATDIDMNALVSEALDEVTAADPTQRTRVVLSDLPRARGDPALLKQVWINLLSNALKYSGRRQTPRVEVSGRVNGGDIVYRTSDNGSGFDMRYYDKLFGVFQRLHSQDEYPGTGVGLAIVHRVVSRHSGRVWAESRVDEGATFYFALPRHEEPRS